MAGTATSMEDRSVARGVLAAADDKRITLAIPGTDYRLELALSGTLGSRVGDKIAGTIKAQARRIDVIKSGGLFVDPVMGRPRNVQGRIIEVDTNGNTLTVNAGVPIVIKPSPRQKAADFRPAQLVHFAAEPGATFTPVL